MKCAEAIARASEVMRRQHKTLATEKTYLHWLRHFIAAIRQMPNELPSEKKLERFLTDLALRDVSAATQNQAFNAILFFYREVLGRPLSNVDALRASRPAQLRHAPSVRETRDLLAVVPNIGGYPTNLIARMLYGCGMRVCEPLNLRIKDVSLDEGTLMLCGAKGRKDRIVPLPCSLAEDLREQMDFARHIWRGDVRNRIPVEIPSQLASKYPEYLFAAPWAWLFPAHRPCKHPITGEMVRYRFHEANVQRAIKAARRKLGIMVLPHELRHAYATHSLNSGVNLKALSEAMGHAQIETTAGYCHATALSVPSPLDPIERTAPAIVESTRRNPGGGKGGVRTDVCEGTPPPRDYYSSSNKLDNSSSLEVQTRLSGRDKARSEQAATERAQMLAQRYRDDPYIMEKLNRRPGLKTELFNGATPMSRKFAVLYERDPEQARKTLGVAAALPCQADGSQPQPARWLNVVLKPERY